MFPSTIVRLIANKNTNNNPTNRNTHIKNKHSLEHLLHLNEPKCISKF